MSEKTPLRNVHYEAFKKSYAKLIKALPINDLLPELVSAGVLSGNLKKRMDATSVESEKVKVMLDGMEGGLKAQIPDQFEEFIRVIEQFSIDESDMVVGKLAKDIRALISASPPEKGATESEVKSSVAETQSHPAAQPPNRQQPTSSLSAAGDLPTTKSLLNIIEELSPEIHSSIDMDSLFPYLMKHITMTDKEYSMLSLQCGTSHKRVANLLEFLRKKDDATHKKFLQALKEEQEHMGHEYLCKLFEERITM